ncbi:Gfo/Idh/MocA family oxidoreductase [Membranicola marinus]|uniref:Gfo/Idh/MocA family oxidoreductase n=1 Tax=Membranihabitans marinus TaxID=1227546 RepID=A0A953HJJ4_9BACT|nr:Gfo/Idh/MocA family oxidoreductase [Membranihabitans marinus]MBY5956887.1 Gfo/Idh/MocA family oxidoreductase [Membranihabitans marinus]
MKRRHFIKTTSAGALATGLLPVAFSCSNPKHLIKNGKVRIAQVGLGMMGVNDLKDTASHPAVEVVALCDVDSTYLNKAGADYPNARKFIDYNEMLDTMGDQIDAVIVSTPDHIHAPVSLKAMNMDKHVYCQKPLTHFVSESREMARVAKDRKLVTQMGIQVHSFYDYVLATELIRGGIVGKVSKVIAWSPKVWGYDGPAPTGSDPIPADLDWELWQGDAPKRPYKDGFYHPSNWRKVLDYGCGTLGDMGVHIFDTPYNALELQVPLTVKNDCRPPNGFGHPEKNHVTYTFPGTKYTTDQMTWVWYDGEGAPEPQPELELPNGEELPDQGAMFIGENGQRLLLPHFMELPRLIVNGEYQPLEIEKYDPKGKLGEPVRDYAGESPKHYHQFVDACMGKAEASAPFSYASKLTEVILLGVIAAQFPGEELHWDGQNAKFREEKANQFISGTAS